MSNIDCDAGQMLANTWPFFWISHQKSKPTTQKDGKLKCSKMIDDVFPIISSSFLWLFQMARLKLLPSPVDRWLQGHCQGQDYLLLQWILATQNSINQLHRLLRQLILHNVLETTHMASRVCQSCQDDFSATCRLAPCLWDMLISKHKLAEMLQQDRCIWTTPFHCCNNN